MDGQIVGLSSLAIWLGYAAVAVFALTGALAAARRGHDIVTFCFFAAATGLGGGSLRDLLLGAPVFWIQQPAYLAVCIAAAGAVWAIGERPWRYLALLWLDGLGLAAYAVVGAAKAAGLGAPPLTAVVMGVLTASFGGVIRDIMANEPSVLLRREIYVTAAVVGAGLFVALRLMGIDEQTAAALGFVAGFGVRAGALRYGWRLPSFQSDDADYR
jgi:uncharacterized membrane protein YeiH